MEPGITSQSVRRLRVLHVFKHITGGGVESWLLQALRYVDSDRFQMDVAVRNTQRSPFDSRFEALGANVYRFSRPPYRLTFAKPLLEILTGDGLYDIIHCHSLFNRGYVLRIARQAGVPVRIAHSHKAPPLTAGRLRRIRVALRTWYMARLWNRGIACSVPAGDELFGRHWRANPDVRLLHCGIDLSPFGAEANVQARDELGIPRDAFVVGHVGRFSAQKNHSFLLDIAQRMLNLCPDTWFLLVGSGELHAAVEASIRQRGIGHRIVIAPQRDDIPRLMISAMDVFLLPSIYEGLPLVGMEAQAAGLPMVISDTISTELDVIPSLVRRLSLTQSADEWASAVLDAQGFDRYQLRSSALHTLQDSPFNIHNSVASLQAFYEESHCVLADPSKRHYS